MTMIDLVTRAIKTTSINTLRDWEAEQYARAAIAAMREPTFAVQEAGVLAASKHPKDIWRVMIDAALTE